MDGHVKPGFFVSREIDVKWECRVYKRLSLFIYRYSDGETYLVHLLPRFSEMFENRRVRHYGPSIDEPLFIPVIGFEQDVLDATIRLAEDFGREVAVCSLQLQMIYMGQEKQESGREVLNEIGFNSRTLDAVPEWKPDDRGEAARTKLFDRGSIGSKVRPFHRERKCVNRQLLTLRQQPEKLIDFRANARAIELERRQFRDDLRVVSNFPD